MKDEDYKSISESDGPLNFVADVENKYKTNLAERFFNLAVDSFRYLQTIAQKKEYDVFRYQISKSASSIGANYEEAQAAISRKEFVVKIGICLKEARETHYFFRLLNQLAIGNNEMRLKILQESEELKKILGAVLLRARKNME